MAPRHSIILIAVVQYHADGVKSDCCEVKPWRKKDETTVVQLYFRDDEYMPWMVHKPVVW